MLYSKTKKRKLLRKTSIIILIFSGLMLAILFTSSIVSKYVIKKYDVEYLGRNVELGWVYANPLTGYIYVRNLKIYESTTLPSLASSDSLFFMAKGVRLNIAMLKLLTKTIEISSLQIDQPKVQLIQNKSAFNFTDLIHKFSIKPTDTIQSKVKFNLLNFKIVNGNLHYCETIIPINYIIKDININSLEMRWNVDSIPMNFAFKSQTGKGSIVGNITINIKSNDYNLAFQASKFDLNILDQYLAELTNYSTLSATLDADFSSKGNFKHPEKVTNKGVIIINDCNLGKNHIDSYLKFSTLVLAMKEVSPHDSIYWYDSIILTKPYIKFEQFDNSDNFQQMFGANWSNIYKVQTDSTRFNLILKIVDYLEILRKNFLISDFKIGKVVIREGVVKYDDYTLNEKFSLEANPFYLAVDSIYKDRNRVQFYVKTGIHPFGNLSAQVDLNPENRNIFELKYHLKGLPVSVFNPYLITYTSFPLNKGTLELEGNWNVKNGDINSINHLIIIDPQIGKRLKNKNNNRIPLPLITHLISNNGNIIDYEIPITGSFKNPKFRWNDLVTNVFQNILMETPTMHYQKQVKNMDVEIENYHSLKWEMLQTALSKKQEHFVKDIATHLLKNPNTSIEIFPTLYTEKEKEYMGVFEAKKKFFLHSKGKDLQLFSFNDSVNVAQMSMRDSMFLEYLNEQVKDVSLVTIQEKCNSLVGQINIDLKLQQLCEKRENDVLLHFKKKGVANRVQIHPVKNTIPFNGFSFYEIRYNGKTPKSLMDATRKLDKLKSQPLSKENP